MDPDVVLSQPVRSILWEVNGAEMMQPPVMGDRNLALSFVRNRTGQAFKDCLIEPSHLASWARQTVLLLEFQPQNGRLQDDDYPILADMASFFTFLFQHGKGGYRTLMAHAGRLIIGRASLAVLMMMDPTQWLVSRNTKQHAGVPG
ncbi:hypothetical protein ACHAQJ_009383 [Trichoderma viride]